MAARGLENQPVESGFESKQYLKSVQTSSLFDLSQNFKNQNFIRDVHIKDLDSKRGNFFLFQPFFYLASTKQNNINELENNLKLEFDVIADKQFWETDNLFVAEGNVKVSLIGGILIADRIEFDQNQKNIIANGNIVFKKGSQYLSASDFQYDLDKKEGILNNVYGVVDLELIAKDLNFQNQSDFDNYINLFDNKDKLTSISKKVKLKDGFILQGGFDPEMNIIDHDKSKSKSITQWRIKAAKIYIKKDLWKADQVSLTNDPYLPAQNRIESFSVEVKESDDSSVNTVITAKRSYLILEDKIKFPIGNREFGIGEEKIQKWITGYDKNDKDGFFVGRKIKPFQINDNFEILLQPQFLIQRSIQGDTKSYPSKGKSVISKKVKSPIGARDLFGLETNVKGTTLDWDTNLNIKITTFNQDRFFHGSRYSLNFEKIIDLPNIDNLKTTFFAAYRDEVFNGSLGSNDIYTSYGTKLEKGKSWKQGDNFFTYKLIGMTGEYQAEKFNKSELITLWRSNIDGSLNIKKPLNVFKGKNKLIYSPLPFSPENINPSLFLNTKISSHNNFYSNGDHQFELTFSVGPVLTIGRLEKKYFDYTKISFMPSYTLKSGDSPFKFDNARDLIKLNMEFSQQIIGPILIKNIYEVNIDASSDSYGNSIQSKTSVIWQRRSYEIGLFYDYMNERGGASFRLNGFDFTDKRSSKENN